MLNRHVVGYGKQQELGFFPKGLDHASSKTNKKLPFGQQFSLRSAISKLRSWSAEGQKELQDRDASSVPRWFFPVWLEKHWVE